MLGITSLIKSWNVLEKIQEQKGREQRLGERQKGVELGRKE
jgi:heme exporter protein D